MILLFTDYGIVDFYVGQLRGMILSLAPSVDVVDLTHGAPNFDIKASAHLLAALVPQIQIGSICLGVIDPGVGTSRDAVVLLADDIWYVGPDNGLFSIIALRSRKVALWRISWRPDNLSRSFHGRDLFAPIAAKIAIGDFPHDQLSEITQLKVVLAADDLPEIIYIDHYGNAMTGMRAGNIAHDVKLYFGSHALNYYSVFSQAPRGQPFWYENSIGLIEIALNCGNVTVMLDIKIGDSVRFEC